MDHQVEQTIEEIEVEKDDLMDTSSWDIYDRRIGMGHRELCAAIKAPNNS